MPAPPNSPLYLAQLYAAMVPDDIRAAITKAEFNDRIVEGARLGAQANDPALSPALRQAARLRAQAVMRAQPRAVTEQQHGELIAKAAATRSQYQADAIRRQADQLIEEKHPVAPRRGAAAVLKAKAEAEADPVAVFNADGDLIGIVDPADITAVSGTGSGAAAQQQDDGTAAAVQDPATDGQVVKGSGGRLVVRDQFGRRFLTDRRSIRKTADDLVTLYDSAGRPYKVNRSAVQSPEAQARNTTPVNVGGTTGLGLPRKTGSDAALPADGPQRARPGDVPGRTVIKSAGWINVRDFTGQVVGIAKQSSVITAPPAALDELLRRPGYAAKTANVYDARRRRIGIALLSDILPVRPGR